MKSVVESVVCRVRKPATKTRVTCGLACLSAMVLAWVWPMRGRSGRLDSAMQPTCTVRISSLRLFLLHTEHGWVVLLDAR